MVRKWGGSLKNNKEACEDAAAIQEDTLEALERIRMQAAETESLGVTTLEELHEQRRQMDRIMEDGDRVKDQLKTTEQLQNKMSRWALNFNKKAAKKEVKEAALANKLKAEVRAERDTNVASSGTLGTVESTGSASVVPKHKSAYVVKRKKKNNKNVQPATNKGVAYGVTNVDEETNEDLNRLAETDAVIDRHLSGVGAQLDGLLELTKEMNTEIKAHDRKLDDVSKQVEEVNVKQKVVNSRARRFLTGKKREDADKQFTLFGIN